MSKHSVKIVGGVCLIVGTAAGALAQRAVEADLVWRWPAKLDAPIAAP